MTVPDSPEAAAAARVAGIEVVAEIGRGAHAVVFRVRRGPRPYALKVFRSTWRDDGVQGAAFRREAALLAGVSTPAWCASTRSAWQATARSC